MSSAEDHDGDSYDDELDQFDEENENEESPYAEDESRMTLAERLKRRDEMELSRAFNNESNTRKKNRRSPRMSDNFDDEAPEERSTLKRANKHAPAVMRSNRPVKRLRVDPNLAIHSKARDPRFSDISGKLNHRKFMDAYGFLNDYQEKEVEQLAHQVKKTKNEEVKQELRQKLLQSSQEIKERKRHEAVQQRLSELKKVEKEKIKSGKKPFFLKQSAKRDIALEERYEELKKTGKLQQFLTKKRKKNANKDHRWLPFQRSGQDGA